MRVARAYSITGLSGFFAPHITSDLMETGAVGGGVAVDKGVEVSVEYVSSGDRLLVKNYINGVLVDNSLVGYVLEEFMKEYSINVYGEIVVNQETSIPIGGGYGTSAASALAIAIALTRLFKIKTTLERIGRIAHKADILAKKGLGTVVGILNPCDGVVLVKKPGGPGVAEIDHILVDEDIYVVSAFYGAFDKTTLLSDLPSLETIRKIGLDTLASILREPSIENFIQQCLLFSKRTGLLKKPLERVIESVSKTYGVLGFSMNMIGDAVFGFVERDCIEDVLDTITKTRKPKWIHYWRPVRCFS